MQFNILPEGSKMSSRNNLDFPLKCWRPPSVIFTLLKYIDFIFPEEGTKKSKFFECFE